MGSCFALSLSRKDKKKDNKKETLKKCNICHLLLWYLIPILSTIESSGGGLGVERWCDNRLHSALVDQIPLGETMPAISMFYVYMVPTPTNLCYKGITSS